MTEVQHNGWVAREFRLGQGGSPSRVFQFDLRLSAPVEGYPRWLAMDGVLLGNGRVLINRRQHLKHLARKAGMDAEGFERELVHWALTEVQRIADRVQAQVAS
jgi:hypothetical protein